MFVHVLDCACRLSFTLVRAVRSAVPLYGLLPQRANKRPPTSLIRLLIYNQSGRSRLQWAPFFFVKIINWFRRSNISGPCWECVNTKASLHFTTNSQSHAFQQAAVVCRGKVMLFCYRVGPLWAINFCVLGFWSLMCCYRAPQQQSHFSSPPAAVRPLLNNGNHSFVLAPAAPSVIVSCLFVCCFQL